MPLKLDASEDEYGIDAADGVDCNWAEDDGEGTRREAHEERERPRHPGTGTNIEELAKYFASWRGKATHIDPNTSNKVAFDAR